MKILLATAALLLLGYSGIVLFVPEAPRVTIQSQWQKNSHVQESYVVEGGTVETVVVGSSVTQRLEFPDDPVRFRNIALAGGSSLTGLELIAASKHQPKRVLVEINFPERDPDMKSVNQAVRFLPKLLPIFQIRNVPVNYFLTQLNRMKKEASVTEPNDQVLALMLGEKIAVHAVLHDRAVLERQIGKFQQLTSALEKAGTEVIFFEMPVHPEVASSPRARQVREAFAAGFPNNKRVESSVLSAGIPIKTLDGVHLGTSESAAVIPRIQALYSQAK